MGLIVNPGIELRGIESKKEFIYYNGKIEKLRVTDFSLFWDIFNSLSKNNTVTLKMIANKHHIQEKQLEKLLMRLKKNGILVNSGNLNPKELRNITHFSAYFNHIASNGELPFKNQTICVIGCGTTGAEIAVSLAKMGVNKIILIDGDTVEEKNIVAQHIFEWQDVGKFKCEVLRNKILRSSTTQKVDVYNSYLCHENQINLDEATCFVDCADLLDNNIRKKLIYYATNHKARYFFCGYSFDQGHIFQFSNSFIATRYLELESKHFDSQYSIVQNRGTITFSSLISGVFLAQLESELLNKTFPAAIRITINTHNLQLEKQDLTGLVLPNLYQNTDYRQFIEDVTKIKNDVKQTDGELKLIQGVFLYLELLDKVSAFPVEIPHLLDQYEFLAKEINSRKNKINDYSEIIKNISTKLRTNNLFDFISNSNSTSLSINKRKDQRTVINNTVTPYIEQLLKLVKRNYIAFKIPKIIVKKFNDENFNPSIVHDFFPNTMDYYNRESDEFTLEDGMKLLSEVLSPSTYDFIIRLFQNNDILFSNSNMNLENNTIFFATKKTSIICMTYKETTQDFLTLLHEIGHARYNANHHNTFSNLDNEISANEFVLNCVHRIIIASQVPMNIKERFKHATNIFFGKELSLSSIILCLGIHLANNEILPKVADYLAFRKRIDLKAKRLGVTLIDSDAFYNNLILAPHLYKNPKTVLFEALGFLLVGSKGSKKIDKETYSNMLSYIRSELSN